MTRKQSVSVSHSAAFSANVSLPCLRLPDTNPEGEKAVYLCCCAEGHHANVVSNFDIRLEFLNFDKNTMMNTQYLEKANLAELIVKAFFIICSFLNDGVRVGLLRMVFCTKSLLLQLAIKSVITKEA